MLPTTPKTILGTTGIIRQADMPSKTYRIDFSSGRIAGTIDGLEAMRQAVGKILQTGRFQYLIYSWNYGTEWAQLIGEDRAAALGKLKQLLEDALTQDDRILGISGLRIVDFNRRDLTVSFTVNTVFGEVGEEITANV